MGEDDRLVTEGNFGASIQLQRVQNTLEGGDSKALESQIQSTLIALE
jgi:hypothetical protein